MEGSSPGPTASTRTSPNPLGAPEVPRGMASSSVPSNAGSSRWASPQARGRRRDEQVGGVPSLPIPLLVFCHQVEMVFAGAAKGGKVSAWERPTLPSPSVNPKVMVADPSDAGTKSTNRRVGSSGNSSRGRQLPSITQVIPNKAKHRGMKQNYRTCRHDVGSRTLGACSRGGSGPKRLVVVDEFA